MKHRIFVSLVALGAAVLLTPLASGTWSGFRSLGTTKVVGTPSCVQLGADEVICVAQSQQHTLMANEFAGENGPDGPIFPEPSPPIPVASATGPTAYSAA